MIVLAGRPGMAKTALACCIARQSASTGESGRMPSRLRTEREQRAGQAAEEVGFGTCRGERKANAAGGLDDTGGDFQETKSQRSELGSGQFPGFGNGVAHGKHQPISGGVRKLWLETHPLHASADVLGPERRTK
jgi:hypothetical protein